MVAYSIVRNKNLLRLLRRMTKHNHIFCRIFGHKHFGSAVTTHYHPVCQRCHQSAPATLSSLPTGNHKIMETTFDSVIPHPSASPYLYRFDQDGILHETASHELSRSRYWWVRSGAFMKSANGRGSNIHGDLPEDDRWRLSYALNNPLDTDDGFHPQNIFRMPTRNQWQNAVQECYFTVVKNNLSQSPNRNASNGLFLFNRYQDENNLYYTGLRVDGSIVIKKKIRGKYYVLAYSKGIFPGEYDRDGNPSLIPRNKWIGIRSEVKNLLDGSVSIKVFIDKDQAGAWKLAADIIDSGSYDLPITQAGYGGIRTDFMDVMFKDFQFRDL